METTRGIASLALGLLLLATPTPATSDDADPGGRSDKLARRLVLLPVDEEQYPYGSGPSFKSVAPSVNTVSGWMTGSGTPDKPEVSPAYRGHKLPFFSGGKNSLYNNDNSEVNPLRQYAPGFPNYPYMSNLPSHLLKPSEPPGYTTTPSGYPNNQYAPGFPNYPYMSNLPSHLFKPSEPPGYTTTPSGYPYHQYESGYSSSPPPSGPQYSQFSPGYPYYPPTPTSPYPQYGQGYSSFPPPAAQYPPYNRGFPPTPPSSPYNYFPPNYPRYPPPPMYSPYGSGYPYSQGYPYSPPWSPWSPPGVPSYWPPYSRLPYRPHRPNRRPQPYHDEDERYHQHVLQEGGYAQRPRPSPHWQVPARPPHHVEDDKDDEDNPVDREQTLDIANVDNSIDDEGFGDENEEYPVEDVKTPPSTPLHEAPSTPLHEESEEELQTKQQKLQRVLLQ